ncbi:MAG: hypothetical protein V2I67_19600 [Thermoanaerobaculales bacterium]|jgi:hypothetical protein|nr:hypothetical protein [Thermoanaerobaculales bacterium]
MGLDAMPGRSKSPADIAQGEGRRCDWRRRGDARRQCDDLGVLAVLGGGGVGAVVVCRVGFPPAPHLVVVSGVGVFGVVVVLADVDVQVKRAGA